MRKYFNVNIVTKAKTNTSQPNQGRIGSALQNYSE